MPPTKTTQPFVFVQLSDTHITPPGELAYGRVDTAAYLARAVDAVRRMTVAPLAALVTGDLANHGNPVAYQRLRELLAPLTCPVYLLPGNHDDRAALRGVFHDHAYLQAADPADFVDFEVELPGLRIVATDTVVAGAAHGALCADRLGRLERRLAARREVPTLLAMHHPPVASFLDYMDNIGLREGSEALEAIVRRHPQVVRIACGHLHRCVQAHWAGTVLQTAPSTAHQVWMDLSPGRGDGFGMDPPGFLVHAWLPGQALVTHLSFTEEAQGPWPFKGARADAH